MSKTKAPRELGVTELAIYEMARAGVLTAAHAVVWRRHIAALLDAGLIKRDAAGVFRDAAPPGTPAPIVEPPPPPMRSLVVRAPEGLLAAIDAIAAGWHTDRSDAVRRLLASAVEAHGAAPVESGEYEKQRRAARARRPVRVPRKRADKAG